MSISTTSQPHRRVSARRGSTTAPDPFGVHSDINLNPNRSTSSTLTIVRVTPQTPQSNIHLHDPPSSHTINQRRVHKFLGQTGGHGQGPTTDNSTNRVSFAFSSFGNSGAGVGGRSSSPSGGRESPSSSPRLRPSSPHFGPTSVFAGKPRLTPDQLVDVARQATSQRPPLPTTTPTSGPLSPGYPSGTVAPATFTPLPDDIYLPFIDRTTEVASLISSPPDAKLFTLLAQTFRRKDNASDAPSSPQVTPDTKAATSRLIELPRDPTQWTYNQLIQHLTQIERDIAPDFIWAIAARKCILSHSELIWERIKGALGVPPELDVDYDFLVEDDTSSVHTSDISDDEGRGARGHWSDWDAVMDSPIYTRASKRLSIESPSPSLYFSAKKDEQEAAFRAQVDEKLNSLPDGSGQKFGEDTNIRVKQPSTEDTIVAPTPHLQGGHSPGVLIDHFGPPLSEQCESPLDVYEESNHVSIEPLLFSMSPTPPTNPPPPASTAIGTLDLAGLGDIAEGAEEEEEEENASNADLESTTAGPASVTEGGDDLDDDDPNLISPSQIQGLKISTSPNPLPFAGSPPITSPIHLPMHFGSQGPSSLSNSYSNIAALAAGTGAQPTPYSPTPYSNPPSRTHSRASSFSSIGPFQRSESLTNLASSWSALAAAHAAAQSGSGSQYAASVIGSDAGDSTGYMSDGDTRMSGIPLFPSNFARLAGGPTLRANHPATKPPSTLPQARYISNVTYGGPSLANRPGKVRAYSHGAASRPGFNLGVPGKRQSWGNTPANTVAATEPKQ